MNSPNGTAGTNRKKHVFPDSGAEAYLPAVSLASIAMKIQRKYPRPMPPVQTVQMGDKTVVERNYAHPDYAVNMKGWEQFISLEATETALRMVKRFPLNETQQAQLDAWKQENEGLYEESDLDSELWLETFAITTTNDFMSLQKFLGAGDVDAEEVRAIQDGF